MEQNKRRQVAKISVFITSIFVIFLSVTYAFINMTLIGTKRQVVTAGNLQVELEEDEAITLNNAMPMYDEVGMLQDAFTFRLVNTGTSKAHYILQLIDITTGDKLDAKLVRCGLTKDGTSTIKYASNMINSRLDKGIINGNQTIHYELRLWIDSSVEDESLISGKTLSYKIGIEIEPEKQYAKYDAVMISAEANETKMFWQYKSQITSISFEPSINIPDTVLEDKKWDVSKTANSGEVMAYVEETGEQVTVDSETLPAYKLHIQAHKGIAASSGRYLFNDFINLVTIDGLEYFDTSKVTDMSSMFGNCSSLTNLGLSYFDTSKVTSMSSMFSGCSSLIILDLSNFDTSNVKNMWYMFNNCSSLASLDVSNFDTSKVTIMLSMFAGCSSLTSLDLSNFDTFNVTNMSSMFDDCSSLIGLDLSSFDTSNVTSMSMMFFGCKNLTNLDVSRFNTSAVTSMAFMFCDCSNLTGLNVSNFDTSNVTDMMSMFERCSGLANVDVNSFDTFNVTNMSQMFSGCSGLTSLDVSHFNTLKVTNMNSMFSGCKNLTDLSINNFDTSSVISMIQMFNHCEKLIVLDLSNFDTTKVTDMSRMFQQCNSLESLNLSSFDISKVTKMDDIFRIGLKDCQIIVKDAETKAWVEAQDTSLTNVVVKSA